MSQHAAPSNDLDWNPEDPHGSIQHEHHIISWQILLLILLILLGCTALTVGVYNLETWVENAFGVHIPKWVNVFGAMSIASIKAVLVCAFFMQLKYDKALNTFAMLFCLLGVGLFLTFSMIDLNTRHYVHEFKTEVRSIGGTGSGLDTQARDENFSTRVSPYIATGGIGIVDFRRQEAIENYFNTEDGSHYAHDPAYEGNPEKAFWHHYYSTHGENPHHHNYDTEDYFTSLGFSHDGHTASSDSGHAEESNNAADH
jgi:caa(3)-type oxidase subunit IV